MKLLLIKKGKEINIYYNKMKKYLKELRRFSILDLKWICYIMNIEYNKNNSKKQIIDKLLKPLNIHYNFQYPMVYNRLIPYSFVYNKLIYKISHIRTIAVDTGDKKFRTIFLLTLPEEDSYTNARGYKSRYIPMYRSSGTYSNQPGKFFPILGYIASTGNQSTLPEIYLTIQHLEKVNKKIIN